MFAHLPVYDHRSKGVKVHGRMEAKAHGCKKVDVGSGGDGVFYTTGIPLYPGAKIRDADGPCTCERQLTREGIRFQVQGIDPVEGLCFMLFDLISSFDVGHEKELA